MTLFETKRCLIKAFKELDLDSFMEYRNNNEWMKYQSFKNLTKEEYKKHLLVPINLETGTQLAIIQKETNQLIGDLYCKVEETEAFIGYTIHYNFARKGYTKEAVIGLVNYLQKNYPNHSIIAETEINNIPSIKVLQSIGFETVLQNEEGYVFRWKNND